MLSKRAWDLAGIFKKDHTREEYISFLNEWRNGILKTAETLEQESRLTTGKGAEGYQVAARLKREEAEEIAAEIRKNGGTVATMQKAAKPAAAKKNKNQEAFLKALEAIVNA